MTMCSLAQRAQTGTKGVDRHRRGEWTQRGAEGGQRESRMGQTGTEVADGYREVERHRGGRQAWKGGWVWEQKCMRGAEGEDSHRMDRWELKEQSGMVVHGARHYIPLVAPSNHIVSG